MQILGEKGLSGLVKRILELILLGGAGIFLSLPLSLKWYLNSVIPGSTENYYFLLGFGNIPF